MAENSKIEWTHHTFNPWRGCTKISEGCEHCYAATMAPRNPKTLGTWGKNGTRVVAAEAAWKEPLKWNRKAQEAGERHRVFCASLADVFEDWNGPMLDTKGERLVIYKPNGGLLTTRPYAEEPPPNCRWLTMSDIRTRLFSLIDATPNLDWLLLTKRPENIAKMMPPRAFDYAGWNGTLAGYWHQMGPRRNLWLGTSVENQKAAYERILHLLRAPAAVRFLSCEPLLGEVDLQDAGAFRVAQGCAGGPPDPDCEVCRDGLLGVDWVIVGGESGHGARPCDIAWIRSIIDQCRNANVACFMKQTGERLTVRNDSVMEWPREGDEWETIPHDYMPRYQGEPVTLRMPHKGGDPEEWPADLRVREFPKGTI